MKKIFQKIESLKNKKLLFFLFLFSSLGVFVCFQPAMAAANPIVDGVLSIITIALHGIIFAFATLAVGLINVLVWVAKISNFIDVPAVEQGWMIVLNFCNMFFILILLIIAFATILRVESYNAKKLLPKLLIAAVLINFSKMICGLFIDFAQLIMLTFVYSFDRIGPENFANMLGLPWVMSFAPEGYDKAATGWAVLGSYILGIIYVIIAIITLGAIIGVLVVRVVMIWIHVAISPLAYLASAFPQGSGFASKWWKDFLNYVFMGPILAFFIWLSFISMQGVAQGEDMVEYLKIKDASGDLVAKSNAPASLTEAGSVDHMIQFAISIGLLLSGLMMAQSASGGMGNAAKIGAKIAKGGLVSGLDKINRFQGKYTGQDFNMKRTAGTLMTGRQAAIAEEINAIKGKADKNADRGGLPGMLTGTASDSFWGRYMNKEGYGRMLASARIGKGGIGIHLSEESKIRSLKDRQNRIERSTKGVYSQEEYTSDMAAGDAMINSESESRFSSRIKEVDEKDFSLKQARADIERELGLERNIVNTTSNNDQRHIDAQSRIAELSDKLTKKTSEIDAYDANAEKTRIRQEEDKRKKDEKLKLDAGLQSRVDEAKKGKLFVSTQAVAEAKRKDLLSKAKEIEEKIIGATFLDFGSNRSHAKAVKDIKQDIDTEDEEQLTIQLRNAFSNKKAVAAEALVEKLASVKGTGHMLKTFGFNETADGFSDFVKEYFEKQMGVDSQTAMNMQSNIGNIGIANGVEHLCMTVSMDNTGKYHRISGSDIKDNSIAVKRADVYARVRLKDDSETLARKAGASSYGYTNKEGQYSFSNGGLRFLLGNLQSVTKELKAARFNKDASFAIAGSNLAKDQLIKSISRNSKMLQIIKSIGGYNNASEFIDAIEARGNKIVIGDDDFNFDISKNS